jgi:hypothetical protein
MMTSGYRASSCQKEASCSYFDFVLEGAFSTGKYISVDRAGALIARNKLPCLMGSVLLSTNFGSHPPLRQGIVRVFRWACERQADGSLRCNHTCTSSVVSHRLFRVRSTRTVSCPLRIPIAPRLDQAGALSHRILPVQVGTLSRGLAWCALPKGGPEMVRETEMMREPEIYFWGGLAMAEGKGTRNGPKGARIERLEI